MRSRRRSRSREEGEIAIAIRDHGRRTGFVVVDDFFLGCGLCFSGFVFSFFFSKYQKIFFGKFFEMQPNTWKYFPFPEISISGKYVFFGKRFTATKHSLNVHSMLRDIEYGIGLSLHILYYGFVKVPYYMFIC